MTDGTRARVSTRRRRRLIVGLLAAPALAGATLAAWYLWPDPAVPIGTTVVSLRVLRDADVVLTQMWAADKPRTVYFVAERLDRPAVVGTAGPSGVSFEDTKLKATTTAWYKDAVAYTEGDGDPLYLRRPYSAAPRKLADRPAGKWTPTWSADGTRIAAALEDADGTACRVRMFAGDGAPIGELDLPRSGDVGGEMFWSPSGQTLLVFIGREPAQRSDPDRDPPDAVIADAPDWSPEGLTFSGPPLMPLTWADDDALATGIWDGWASIYPMLGFTWFSLDRDNVAFDCREIWGGRDCAVWWPGAAVAAPNGSGVIAAVVAEPKARTAVRAATNKIPALVELRYRLKSRVDWWAMDKFPSWTVYAYIPASGEGSCTIARDEGSFYDTMVVSADGTELLYKANWELRAVPLPPEARKRPE